MMYGLVGYIGLNYLQSNRSVCLSLLIFIFVFSNKYLTKNKVISLLVAIIVLHFSCSFFISLGKKQRRVTFSSDTKKE